MNCVVVFGYKSSQKDKINPIFEDCVISALDIVNEDTLLVLTGGKTKRNSLSEAQLGHELISSMDTDLKIGELLLEENSRITLENILNVKKLVSSYELEKIYFVAAGFHIRRILMLVNRHWSDILHRAEFVSGSEKNHIVARVYELLMRGYYFLDRKARLAKIPAKFFRNG